MIDNLVAFATTWDGGMERCWIMYDIHAITAEDLELLAQERAAELSTELKVDTTAAGQCRYPALHSPASQLMQRRWPWRPVVKSKRALPCWKQYMKR